ncbi:MAG: hypothetical protein ACHRHE_17690 [Tepidisphaerales bacterium]
MKTHPNTLGNLRRGVASVLAMMYLVLFSTLALGFYAATTTTVQTSDNYKRIAEAHNAAEAGMQFMRYQLGMMSIPASTPQNQLFAAVYTQLQNQINNTGNLAGGTISSDGVTIYVPGNTAQTISLDASNSRFRARVFQNGPQLRVIVNGYSSSGLKRSLQMDYNVAQRASAIFDYGVASKSAITMNGNVTITGLTNPAAGSVLSATLSTNTPLTMVGNDSISGDVSLVNPNSSVSVSSSSSIAGSTNPSSYASHIHTGVDMPEFPTIDTSPFAPYATNNITASKPAGKSFSNIRIKANTNPSFAANTTITGVVYIETPNQVSFAGNLTLQGVVVVQNNPTGNTTTNTISFGGNVAMSGVDTLPASFGALRTLTGAAILAPNFAVSFGGNFGSINGSIIGSSMNFHGNAGGTVTGSVINLNDTAMSFSGNDTIKIQSQGTSNFPAGVKFGSDYVPLPDTYLEIIE